MGESDKKELEISIPSYDVNKLTFLGWVSERPDWLARNIRGMIQLLSGLDDLSGMDSSCGHSLTPLAQIEPEPCLWSQESLALFAPAGLSH